MFLVPKKDGKQRPVINLKVLNQYVQTYHFKMEGLQTLKDLIKPIPVARGVSRGLVEPPFRVTGSKYFSHTPHIISGI